MIARPTHLGSSIPFSRKSLRPFKPINGHHREEQEEEEEEEEAEEEEEEAEAGEEEAGRAS